MSQSWRENGRQQAQKCKNKVCQIIGHPFRGAVAKKSAHYQTEIARGGVDQIPLGHVFETADRHPAKISTAFEQGKAALHQFGSEATQPLAFVATGAVTILVKLTAGNLVSMPAPPLFALSSGM